MSVETSQEESDKKSWGNGATVRKFVMPKALLHAS
ncbi:MAG: hypothetical protein QOH35_133 [Acidobacteriaceae bacterium]|jgi:hypothetical protein|nr:hypothetical protein [Acidobacteriaceae bacterium]